MPSTNRYGTQGIWAELNGNSRFIRPLDLKLRPNLRKHLTEDQQRKLDAICDAENNE